MLDDDNDDGYGVGFGVGFCEGRFHSPRQAIFSLSAWWRWLVGGGAVPFLCPMALLLLLLSSFRVIVDATVVIRCICGVALSFAHTGVLAEHFVAPDG